MDSVYNGSILVFSRTTEGGSHERRLDCRPLGGRPIVLCFSPASQRGAGKLRTTQGCHARKLSGAASLCLEKQARAVRRLRGNGASNWSLAGTDKKSVVRTDIVNVSCASTKCGPTMTAVQALIAFAKQDSLLAMNNGQNK